jgi:hypothetical protein
VWSERNFDESVICEEHGSTSDRERDALWQQVDPAGVKSSWMDFNERPSGDGCARILQPVLNCFYLQLAQDCDVVFRPSPRHYRRERNHRKISPFRAQRYPRHHDHDHHASAAQNIKILDSFITQLCVSPTKQPTSHYSSAFYCCCQGLGTLFF